MNFKPALIFIVSFIPSILVNSGYAGLLQDSPSPQYYALTIHINAQASTDDNHFIYNKKIFVSGNPENQGLLQLDKNNRKIMKLLKMKAKYLNFEKERYKYKVELVDKIEEADLLLFYEISVNQEGTMSSSSTSGSSVTVGSSSSKMQAKTVGKSQLSGSTYGNNMAASANSSLSTVANLFSSFYSSSFYGEQTNSVQRNLYEKKMMFYIFDVSVVKDRSNMKPLCQCEVTYLDQDKRIRNYDDFMMIAGIYGVGLNDLDVDLEYSDENELTRRIIATLYTDKSSSQK